MALEPNSTGTYIFITVKTMKYSYFTTYVLLLQFAEVWWAEFKKLCRLILVPGLRLAYACAKKSQGLDSP